MDDPMVRSRLGRANGTRLWGFPIPSGAPSFFPSDVRAIQQLKIYVGPWLGCVRRRVR